MEELLELQWVGINQCAWCLDRKGVLKIEYHLKDAVISVTKDNGAIVDIYPKNCTYIEYKSKMS